MRFGVYGTVHSHELAPDGRETSWENRQRSQFFAFLYHFLFEIQTLQHLVQNELSDAFVVVTKRTNSCAKCKIIKTLWGENLEIFWRGQETNAANFGNNSISIFKKCIGLL